MKILSCTVAGFGGISDRTVDFESGVTVILEDNGWGKTSLSRFIRAMFYGLGQNRSTDATQNERLRFTPWSGGAFGGSLTFLDSSGERLRIERTFGQKEAADTFALLNADTGLPSSRYSERVGWEIFGIDPQGFEQSVYVSERALRSAGGDYSGIQAKLVNLGDLSDYAIAEKKLDKARSLLRLHGGRGRIRDLTDTLAEKRDALRTSEEACRRTDELLAEANGIDKRITLAEEKLTRIRATERDPRLLAESAAVSAHEKDLADALARAKDNAASLSRLFGNVPPTEEEAASAANALARLSEEDSRPEPRTPSVKPVLLLSLLCVLSVAGGALLSLVAMPLLFAGIAVGAVLLTLALVLGVKRGNAVRRIAAEEEEKRAADDALRSSVRRLLDRYPLIARDPAFLTDAERVFRIRALLTQLAAVKAEVTAAEERCAAFRAQHPAEETAVAAGEDAARLAEEQAVKDEIDSLRGSHRTVEREIGALASAAERRPELVREIAGLEEDLAAAESGFNTVISAMDMLAAARDNLKERYLGGVQERFRAYMEKFTMNASGYIKDRYPFDEYTVSADFDVTLKRNGFTRSTLLMSEGERVLVSLCLHFAIADALFPDEKPPFILDDPLVYLDDELVTHARALLESIGKERQIVYFTCHTSRA